MGAIFVRLQWSGKHSTPEPWRALIDFAYNRLGEESPVANAFETWVNLSLREAEGRENPPTPPTSTPTPEAPQKAEAHPADGTP